MEECVMTEEKIVAELHWHHYLEWRSTKIHVCELCFTHTYPLHLHVHAFIHVTQANIVRCEASRQLRIKNKEYLKATIDEL
jgi:hypothetical protein